MASISDLLRYKAPLKLVDPRHPEKTLMTVWVRTLGDDAIKDAYKFSRIASAEKRAALKDTSSPDYIDALKSLGEQDDTDLIGLITAQKESEFRSLATAVIEREDLPKMEEIAKEPDAPTLEEQEILDKKEKELAEDYDKRVEEYVQTKVTEYTDVLNKSTHEELVELGKQAMANLVPMQVFIDELQAQKGFRGTFLDKECKTRAFETIEEYKESDSAILNQIIEKYTELEIGPDEIKN